MRLTREQMATMIALLDESIELDAARRKRWLEHLSSENQDLVAALREALIPAAASPLDSLAELPKSRRAGTSEASTSTLAPGKRMGPYELERPLGSGGMAEVWLARRADGAFKREVALKLPRLTSRRGHLEQRFLRERDILARLEHPNIARLYDAGVDDQGLPYLAMEYVPGQAITAWCDAKRLPLPKRLELVQQVIQAVRYAHEHRVIHRDIKPSNILVSERGEVRLLDFGVAMLLEQSNEGQLTRIYGRALTPDYASPELLRGDAIDTRGDIYSLGVVLYELLTGHRPYALNTNARIRALEQAIATVEVKKPSTQVDQNSGVERGTTQKRLAHQLRGDLDMITLKALAKEPSERYESAKAMAEDLERYLQNRPISALPAPASYRARKFVRRNRTAVGLGATAVAAVAGALAIEMCRAPDAIAVASRVTASATVAAFNPPPHSIAVLPLVNMSGDKNQEYFSDGVTEELITALSQAGSLKVIARTSSFALKGRNVDISTIARALNVGSILEGSVRLAGSQVRVTVQLVDGRDGFHTWSYDYDRNGKDVLVLQRDIATAAAQQLQAKLLGDESSQDRSWRYARP